MLNNFIESIYCDHNNIRSNLIINDELNIVADKNHQFGQYIVDRDVQPKLPNIDWENDEK